MSIIDDLKNYSYVGLPFEAFGWPGPVYNRLVGSNDGLNWTCLQKYDTSWRDCDIAKINGHYFICATDYNIYWTDDFESFNKIEMTGKYPMAWAPEWFKDNDGTWYIFYATGDSSMTNHFIMMYRTFDPESLTFGEPTQVTFSTGNDGKIDPNINYVDGYYYLWIANQISTEIELYRSKSLSGTFEPVKTNITQLVSGNGFTKNEAPEMMYENGMYWLYFDPWKDGLGEHDRCMYRATSNDMLNWSSLEKLECSFGLRHFTPLKINTNSSLKMWDGNVNNFYPTNRSNYEAVNDFIDSWNNSDNSFIEPITFKLDATNYSEVNRLAYRQFISNAKILLEQIPKMVEDYRVTDFDYTCVPPTLPTGIDFNQTEVNNLWKWVSDNLTWIMNQVQQVG